MVKINTKQVKAVEQFDKDIGQAKIAKICDCGVGEFIHTSKKSLR